MKKINVIAAFLILLISITYLQCTQEKNADPRGNLYAGSAACIKCHSNNYSTYLHTAHYVAALPASSNTIHGSFEKNSNIFNFGPGKQILMEKKNGKFFQSYYFNKKLIERDPFDIVMGGIKGESYLYWKGNTLNQLPVSYFTKEHQWLLSPRFDPRFVNFNRSITSRCLECHASFVNDQPGESKSLTGAEQFDKSTLVYSVDCERCHGPAAQHVDYQTNNPTVKTAKFISVFTSLPRARQMDMCAVCHSGNKSQTLQPTFGFKPGDTLANFRLPGLDNSNNAGQLDVHGNQVQLLQSSKCFIYSKMNCATCHNTHQNQRGNSFLFTQKCLACHSQATHNYCKAAKPANMAFIKSNCIQCHMPAFNSTAIVSQTIDKSALANVSVHTHRIAIYPAEAQKILQMIGK